jgi:hypothetical protein
MRPEKLINLWRDNMTCSITAPAGYQHKGYSIELKTTSNGVEIKCTHPDEDTLFMGARSTHAEAIYTAMRTIDARAIATKIDAAVDAAQCPDAAADQITELVQRLVTMISNA